VEDRRISYVNRKFSSFFYQSSVCHVTASAFVKETTGVDCVCERSAILAGGGAELLLKKRAANGVTVALALKDWSVDFG